MIQHAKKMLKISFHLDCNAAAFTAVSLRESVECPFKSNMALELVDSQHYPQWLNAPGDI